MDQRFANKVMVITGAAQGIGQRVAELAAQQGAKLALVDRSPLVQELRDRLAAITDVIAVEVDLETFQGAEQAAEAAFKAFRRIDILVNNVGGTIWTKPFEHYSPEEIEAEVRRSLFPTLWGCRAVLPYMLKKKKGAIVNVSSIATRSVNRVPYGAAKGGVNAMTACLAFENGERGIRINAVAPGGTVWNEDNIGQALAGREVSRHLRELGVETRGHGSFGAKQRSRFLQALNAEIQTSLRGAAPKPASWPDFFA